MRQLPLSHSFCQYAIASGQPLVIPDARVHPLGADNLAVRDLGLIAYAGIPLVLSDGYAVGALCAIDGSPREWSEQDMRILADLAAAVTAHLEVRRALAERSLEDRLTGLANHPLLCAQADQLLEAARPAHEATVAAICIGLDGFGLVSDAYGAAAADRVLQEVGERLAAEARAGDMLGRPGGDLFALLGRDMGDERAAIRFAGRLRAAVSNTWFDVDGHRVGVTATVGLAIGTAGKSGADLLQSARDAMRRGKASAGTVITAVDGTGEIAAAQLRLRAALSGAVGRGEMYVAYQPIVRLDSGTPVSYEALARWNSPELGSVAGRLHSRGRAHGRDREDRRMDPAHGLRTAGRVALRWSRRVGLGEPRSASARASQPQGHRAVRAGRARSARPRARAGDHRARTDRGGRPADAQSPSDTSTRGAALTGRLRHRLLRSELPQALPDRRAEDRPLLRGDDGGRRRDAALVQAILALAEGLSLKVVAEGIETPGQREQLKLLGCRLGQGYLFARPCPAELPPAPAC